MKNRISIFLAIVFLSMTLTGCYFFPPVNHDAEWTVMVYLDSDNNLESVGINDINEMEIAGSTADVNILVQVDRIPFSVLDANNQGYSDDASNGDWTTTRRYYITQDADPIQINSYLIKDLGEMNMGDPQTLEDFVNWGTTSYPAEKYLLVIWNHGGGFKSNSTNITKDIAWDFSNGEDRITMPELENALSAISSQLGKKIDILGMDACFMGMTEVAYQVKDHADIFVSSEETVPGAGWPYDTIFGQLVGNPSISPEQLATDIVEKYIDSYGGYNVTQSAVDLSYMDVLAGKCSDLAAVIMGDSKTQINKYISAANDSQYYVDYDFIDLYDFCNKLLINSNNNTVKNIASDIQETLNSAIIQSGYSGGGTSGSMGLSIYFPYYYYSDYYNNTHFAGDTFWDEMLLHLGF